MFMNLLKSKNKHYCLWWISKRCTAHVFPVPEDWVTENGAGDSTGRCLERSDRFELPLLLLLGTQLCLWCAVGLLADLRLQIVRVVSAPPHQEHSANKGHQLVWRVSAAWGPESPAPIGRSILFTEILAAIIKGSRSKQIVRNIHFVHFKNEIIVSQVMFF